MADHDGIGKDRRNFLKCMAWVGAGAVWTLNAGVLKGTPLGMRGLGASPMGHALPPALRFVQISDSHIGFNKEANHDVTATLREVAQRIASSPERPAFVIHTGDLTHLSTDEQFDTVDQILRETGLPVFYVPGEHDVLSGDDGRGYRSRFAKDAHGSGWYSFDHGGVHFVGLVNVVNMKGGGLGTLGDEQIEWLQRDLAPIASSTPVVVFAHIPLWSVYPEWGWGTDDSARALSHLKRFGSVSVLNGHIHQVMQKVEGHVTFHTAMSTAFPQPAPGAAASPGPMTVEPARLRQLLGLSSVAMLGVDHPIAITDVPLAAETPAAAGGSVVTIDNFRFSPQALPVAKGATVTWTNHDDVPHTIVSTAKAFTSPVLDTDGRYSRVFDASGTFDYYCSLHPRMTGTVVVA